MDKICEKFVTINKSLVSPLSKLGDVFTYCLRNVLNQQIYYDPHSHDWDKSDVIICEIVDGYADEIAHMPLDKTDIRKAYKTILNSTVEFNGTVSNKRRLGLLGCIIHAAMRGNLLLIPPNVVAENMSTSVTAMSEILLQLTFSQRLLSEYMSPITDRGVDPIYGYPLTITGLWKGIRDSLFLLGKQTDYGFGLSRLGGAARVSVGTQTVTLETPMYKIRRTLTDDKYEKYYDAQLVFLWWLSTVPLLHIADAKETKYCVYKDRKDNDFVTRYINDDLWYRTKKYVFKVDSGTVYLAARNVQGVAYGMPRDLTKLRYIEGTGDTSSVVNRYCDRVVLDAKGVCDEYYSRL